MASHSYNTTAIFKDLMLVAIAVMALTLTQTDMSAGAQALFDLQHKAGEASHVFLARMVPVSAPTTAPMRDGEQSAADNTALAITVSVSTKDGTHSVFGFSWDDASLGAQDDDVSAQYEWFAESTQGDWEMPRTVDDDSAVEVVRPRAEEPDQGRFCVRAVHSGETDTFSCVTFVVPSLSAGTLVAGEVYVEDVPPPTVRIIGLQDDEVVSGDISTGAAVTSPLGIDRVVFLINGQEFADLSSPPYSISWDTNAIPNGTYTIRVAAYDIVGNKKTSRPVVIRVRNTEQFDIPVRIDTGQVSTTAAVRVRSEPSLSGSVIATVPAGARGSIIDGPRTADGETWVRVSYDNGVTGWTAREWLE